MSKIKKEATRSMFGLTQQEIAMLINVSRSHWSHYEGNRRSLPSAAGLRLDEIKRYMLLPEAKASENLSKFENGHTKRVIEKRLEENEYQLERLNRKIDKAQQKLEKYEKAAQLMAFLNSPEEVKKAPAPEILSSITGVAMANFRETKSELHLLKIDRELLLYEAIVLKKGMEEK